MCRKIINKEKGYNKKTKHFFDLDNKFKLWFMYMAYFLFAKDKTAQFEDLPYW